MNNSVAEVTIRQFEKQDFAAVRKIVLQGFKNKFSVLSSLGDKKLLALLTDSNFIPSQSFEGYLVASFEEQILGVMVLKWKGQKRPPSTALSPLRLIITYGCMTMVKYYICLALLEEYIDAHTCYVELLAVDEQARGLGIGTALLNRGLLLMEKQPLLHTFSLYVAEGNAAAYRLYTHMGIRERGKKHNLLAKLFFNEGSWVYMSSTDSRGERIYYVKRKGWWLGFLGALGVMNLPSSGLWFVFFLWFLPERR